MSRYKFEVNTNKGKKEVLLGWDVPCQWFFLVIDEIDDEQKKDEPEWSNLNFSNPRELKLDQIEKVLKEYDIKEIDLSFNSELRKKLLGDKINNN